MRNWFLTIWFLTKFSEKLAISILVFSLSLDQAEQYTFLGGGWVGGWWVRVIIRIKANLSLIQIANWDWTQLGNYKSIQSCEVFSIKTGVEKGGVICRIVFFHLLISLKSKDSVLGKYIQNWQAQILICILSNWVW